jgi:membrane protease YdiL (CAAX protease family)
LFFSVAVTLLLFGITFASRAVFPMAPVGDISKLPQKALEPPEGLGLILSDMKSPDTLFWALAILLGFALLAWTGWWDDAGFTRPSRWRNIRLLAFPLLVCALTLSSGVFTAGPVALISTFLTVLVATIGEETIFRGLLWRAFVQQGPVLTYGALRWRTTSIWPAILVHTVFAFAVGTATLGTFRFRLVILLSTVGFVAYGLYMLRNPRVRADGGLTKRAPSRVR